MKTERLSTAIRIALLALCVSATGHRASAQETINYASVSGRVTDPAGRASSPGAQVDGAADRDERHGRDRSTDQRRALPLSVPEGRAVRDHGAPAGVRRRDARADADRRRGVRAAGVARGRRRATRASPSPADATVLEAARSQIAGTVSQAEVQNLPMNGRNFLDLALLVPGVSPTNIGSTQLFAETSAVPGQRHLRRQPAQLLQQLHRRRPVGQRRCGGAERHSVRRGRGGSVSGGHVGRAGGARAARSAATSTS